MIKADLTNKIAKELNLSKQEAEEGVNLFFERGNPERRRDRTERIRQFSL